MSLSRVAIIGTGITALSIGHYLPLVNPLVEITFFDKGQKPGGRVATRRSRNNPELLFDHGAPFLWEDNVKGDLRKVLDDLNVIRQVNINIAKNQSLKGYNQAKIVSKNVLVGMNGLDSVTQSIFKSVKNVQSSHFEQRVISINQNNEKELTLGFEQTPSNTLKKQSSITFHQVYCCIPFPQATSISQQLLSLQPYKNIMSNYHAHWIVLLSVKKGQLFAEYKDTDVIQFKVQHSPIKYAVKQNKKFQKLKDSNIENWTVYFNEKWTNDNLKLTKQQVQERLVKQILPQYTLTSVDFKPQFITVHRWLYSSPKQTGVIKAPLISQDKRLIFAGDWVNSRQSVGQCWTLGKQIVQELNGKVLSNKSKL